MSTERRATATPRGVASQWVLRCVECSREYRARAALPLRMRRTLDVIR
jgi:hypothetical protein